MAQKDDRQLKDSAEQARLLRGWEEVTLTWRRTSRQPGATAVEGGSFLEGMLPKAQKH